jgi:hypothetical protein
MSMADMFVIHGGTRTCAHPRSNRSPTVEVQQLSIGSSIHSYPGLEVRQNEDQQSPTFLSIVRCFLFEDDA